MSRQFTIRNLLVLVAVFSVASWMVTINWHYGVVWLGMVFGIYVARRCDYPWMLMAMCGMLWAVLSIMSVVGLNAVIKGYFPLPTSLAPQTQTLSKHSYLLLVIFDAILWCTTLMIFGWFISVLRRARIQRNRRMEDGHANAS